MKSYHRQVKHSGTAAILLTMLVAATMFAGTVVPAQAQTFTSLYSFQGTTGNYGAYPQGLVQGTDGNLYGVTAAGGDTFDSGTFYKISTGGDLKTFCSFYDVGPCRDSQAPSANLVEGTNGDFYGVDLEGQIIRLTTRGKLKVLYTNANAIPRSSLILASNGDFYGTTVNGGANGQGDVFKITSAGKLTTVYSFCSVIQNNICLDGAQPNLALVEGSDGNLYGTTSIGGNDGVNDGYGTIFKMTLTGSLTTIYNFPGFTQSSSALIQGADGNFYGTTANGGTGEYGAGGTFFTVTPSGALTTLYNFCSQQNCTDGEQPANIYLATDGNFYGITWYGGVSNNNQGTIFQFTPSGTLTTLHNFDGTDGSGPAGGGTLMQDTNGTLYGTMLQGGNEWPSCADGCVGTIFSLDMGLGPFVETLPTSGKVKAAVKILGTNLTGATSVTFNGTAATFTVASSSEITTTVPEGATTGVVKLVTAGGTTLTSNTVFQVP
jgi:uncharacterized repeat protein (TIGR03803 family)